MIGTLRRWREMGLLSRATLPVTFVNLLFQRFLGISGRCSYLLHYTSMATAPEGIVLYGQGISAEQCLALNGGVLLQASNGIRIHRSVLIAPGAKIISGNHDIDNFLEPSLAAPGIEIMQKCWIGANAIILPGVRLLPGTIVGAGSVVVRSFSEDNIVVAGNPARVVKRRMRLDVDEITDN